MKEKIISIALLLVLMALLPFAAAKCCMTDSKAEKAVATADSVQNNDKNKVLCGLVAAQYKNNYCAETLKALTIILNTNYKINPQSFDLADKNVCLYEKDADNSVKEIYSQISEKVNSVKEFYLSADKKMLTIPFSDFSDGHTVNSSSCSYITSVASPWDCFDKNNSYSGECVGVSIGGIDYLCRNGADYKEALMWYLPAFEIDKT